MKDLPQKKGNLREMILLAVMSTGLSSVEMITNNMVPITLRHFTDSALIISTVLATNRLFGFIVQPYICWKSDFVQTRLGRRRVFLLFSLPSTLILLLLVGLLPIFYPGDIRHTLGVLALVIFLNILLQAVADVNWGTLEPLYADTFRQEQLGRAASIRQVAIQCVNLILVFFVLSWADFNEIYPYLVVACILLLSVFIVVRLVREVPNEIQSQPHRYNPIQHLSLLINHPDYGRLAFVCACNLVLPATLFLFTPLYVTGTLGMSLSELGKAQFMGPVLSISLAIPIGYWVDRYGPRWIMTIGYCCYLITFSGFAFYVKDFNTLFATLTVFGVAQVLALMPMTAMVFQYASKVERGQIFGLIQFVRAFSTFVISLLLGWAVTYFDSYDTTPIYPVDIKQVTAMEALVYEPENKAQEWVLQEFSLETQEALRLLKQDASPKNQENARLKISADFNRLIVRGDLKSTGRFIGINFSRQSEKLYSQKQLDNRSRQVLNRSLLQDAFNGILSSKINYRIPYYIGIVLAVLAIVVTLNTRRGKYARILRESTSEAP